MANFTYKARDSEGKVVTGTVEGDNRDSVFKSLTDQGLFIVELKEKKKDSSSFFSLQLKKDPTQKKVKPQEVVEFTRQLQTMLKAGLPLLNSIRVMIKQVSNPGLKKVLSDIADDVKGGAKFSESLNKHPKLFDQMYVSMIEAGEEGGVLEEILNRLVKIMEKELDTKSKIKSALTYPIIIVFIAFGVVGFLTTFIFPQFIDIFLQSDVALPLPTQMLFSFSNFVRGYWYLIVVVLFIAVYILKKYRATEKGRFVTDGIILKTPLIGDLISKVVLGRFARTLASLYSSGVPILSSLDIVKKSITNSVICGWMDKVKEGVTGGKSLAKPMEQVGEFPPMMVQMIATGEETGSVSEMLNEIANSYEIEVDYTVKNVTSAIEPLLIVFMGIVVGFTALSLFLPMFDMMSLVR